MRLRDGMGARGWIHNVTNTMIQVSLSLLFSTFLACYFLFVSALSDEQLQVRLDSADTSPWLSLLENLGVWICQQDPRMNSAQDRKTAQRGELLLTAR